LNIEHNKLQKDYKNMEEILSKQQKEVEELKVDNAMHIKLRMKYKGKLTKSMHKWTKIYKSRWLLMKN
jgi:ribosome maturation protein Sdo1